ncbi:MAG: ABC transporter ATP-binding protein [Planctomycetota bacterium]
MVASSSEKVPDPALETHELRRVLGDGEAANEILHGLNISVSRGEFCSIVGPSGSGKSTLMYLLGALDKPTSGKVIIDRQDTGTLRNNELAALRNRKLGFIFQFHYLMPEFTAAENIMMPMFKAGVSRNEAAERAHELLGRLGIADKYNRVPGRLSGGEQQRVAIARALANRPLIVLGDEPTGNLDTHNADNVFDVFRKLVKEESQTIIVVTHDPNMAARTDRMIRLVDGNVVEDGPTKSVLSKMGVGRSGNE